MSSTADRSPVDQLDCEACGKPYEATPRNEVYSIAIDQDVASFQLCPPCAVALADEIAANIPDIYLDILADAVRRRAARRVERGVAL